MKLYIDSTTTHVSDLTDKGLIRALREALSYQVEVDRRTRETEAVYLFVPRCEGVTGGWASGWDFPTGLLSRVLAILDSRKAAYQIVTAANLLDTQPDPALAGMYVTFDCRDYQTLCAVDAVRPREGRRGGVIQAATGSGKTRIAAKIIQLARVKTLFLVNTKDLLHQTKKEFETLLDHPIGVLGDGKKVDGDIVVATVQTVARMEKDALAEFKLVIADEVHGIPADQAYDAVMRCTGAHTVVGLSASPWRDDGLDILIEAACGPVIREVSASDLIDRKLLVPPTIHMVRLPLPYHPSKDMASDNWPTLYKAWVLDWEPRHNITVALALPHLAKGETVLILVTRIEHGEKLSKLIPGSVFLEGSMTSKQRKKVLDDTRSGALKCLISTRIADQGLDLPLASVLILAGAGKSSTRALQRIGRVLRTHPQKTAATVYDLVDANYILSRQALERLKIYRTERAFEVVDLPIPARA